jgi:catechol 2,3-dioxygenase-like lactoylglutathione lyase family enzyme
VSNNTTKGIEGLLVETRNWGKTVAFWQDLGFVLEFETDHHSGQLRHPAGGPWLFVAERLDGPDVEIQPIVGADAAATFVAPSAGEVEHRFEARHWGVEELLARDPDGRHVSIQAPLPAGAEAPPERAHA